MKRYPLVIERTSTGYSAYSPDVPGCAAVGDTEEDTRRNFQDDFCRIHRAIRVTPAMETGIADHVWSIAELLGSC